MRRPAPFAPRARAFIGLAGLVLFSFAGCAHYVQRGETLFREHRYIEAAEAFERTEFRIKSWSEEDRATFGLYRGLTFLYLGDVPSAGRWLDYSRVLLRIAPGTLDSDARRLLEQGLVEWAERSAPPEGTATTGVARFAARKVAAAEPPPPTLVTRAPPNGRRSVATP